MENLVSQINDILSSWKVTFDLLSQVRLAFSLDPHMVLCLNDIQLCPAKPMVLDHVSYDAEQISFLFADLSRIQITITWPEEAAPFMSDVQFITGPDTQYKAGEC